MKKIISIITFVLAIIIIWNTMSYAAALQATIKITPNSTEIKKGETVTFSMQLVNVANAEGGIVGAISGNISYDTNFFEGLTYSGITMNESTGKFTKMDSFTNNSNIGTITLKVKSDATGTGTITFTELAANDGRDDYEEGEATTPNETFSISIKEDNNQEENPSNNEEEPSNNEENPSNNEEENPSNNQEKENTQTDTNNDSTNKKQENNSNIIETSKSSDEKKSNNVNTVKSLPKTGEVAIIIPIILIGILFSIIMLKKYKEYKKI